ncbi:T9SS type A sorting domain-containing protein [candidate division WOR-3 bacterium]|nr:T9SS type A sorting domain-containing protein [candidate division WOR-3 bacterium]
MNNIIGLAIDLTPLPNNFHGVAVGEYGPSQWGCADMNQIGPYNIIAYNGGDGVAVWEDHIDNINADGNLITLNSIYDNNGLGIDLQNNSVTFNDPADPDSGPNQELNYPVIDSALYNVVQTTVYGTIDIDTDPTQAIVEVFKAKVDPSNYGEGEIYLGSTNPDASGNWSIVVSGLIPGDTVTATTTDLLFNTSEFCDVNLVVSGLEEIPIRYELSQNYPNPFTNTTTIQYAISKTTHVKLSVFDVSGRLIKVLAEGVHNPSYYNVNWNGKDNSGRKVSQGVYFYRLEAKGYITSKKLIFLR